MMAKRKRKNVVYVHTMDGAPATFDGECICFAPPSYALSSCATLGELKKERRKSIRSRKKDGIHRDITVHGHLRVQV
jgi:hypothetical protein